MTKDPHIRSNQLERAALLENRVAAFMLGRGDITGSQMATLLLNARDPMYRALRRFHVAIIASISVESVVTVLFADSQKLDKPVRLHLDGVLER